MLTGGEFLTFLGPSGSGKSTLLMIIAGFIRPTAGMICFADQDVTRLKPHKRNIGVVFQNYALFPHMSVGGNVGLPPASASHVGHGNPRPSGMGPVACEA